MGVPERFRERIESYIAGLERTYGGFPVNQTTVSLPDERYTKLREEGGFVEAYIRVRDDRSDVLRLADGTDPALPGVRVSPDGPLEARLREAVEDQAGIRCVVDGLRRATIAGVRNAEDTSCETLYSLVVVFTGTHTEGVPGEGAEWSTSAGQVELPR
jgi:hypothetical protein